MVKKCQLEVRNALTNDVCKIPKECTTCGWLKEEDLIPKRIPRDVVYPHSKKVGPDEIIVH